MTLDMEDRIHWTVLSRKLPANDSVAFNGTSLVVVVVVVVMVNPSMKLQIHVCIVPMCDHPILDGSSYRCKRLSFEIPI